MDGMSPATAKLWATQNRHEGDRHRLFAALRNHLGDGRVLYAGSYVDVAPSFVFSDVVYVDMDKRAAAFFADVESVDVLVGAENPAPGERSFVHADYHDDLGLEDASFDVLVSLYAGVISEPCTRYLRIGGHLVANASHGDASVVALDDRYRLTGVVIARDSDYRVRTEGLNGYLVPKRPELADRAKIIEAGRGVAYTKPAFAYVFERVR